MTTLTKKERAWLNDLQDVLDRCPSPKKIGFYTIGDKNIYLYDLRRMDEIMEALDNRSSMDWCAAVHDMNAGFDEPVAWTDEEELRDVKRYGLGEIFQYPPDKYADSRRVIPLYRVPPASIVQAQSIEIAINELVALSPRLDKRAAETLSMAVAQLRKLVKKQLQAKD